MVGDGTSTWGSLPSLNAKEDEEGGGRGGGERGRKRGEGERKGMVEGEGGGGGGDGGEGGGGVVGGGSPSGMPCFTKCKQGITLFHYKAEKRCQRNANFLFKKSFR